MPKLTEARAPILSRPRVKRPRNKLFLFCENPAPRFVAQQLQTAPPRIGSCHYAEMRVQTQPRGLWPAQTQSACAVGLLTRGRMQPCRLSAGRIRVRVYGRTQPYGPRAAQTQSAQGSGVGIIRRVSECAQGLPTLTTAHWCVVTMPYWCVVIVPW